MLLDVQYDFHLSLELMFVEIALLKLKLKKKKQLWKLLAYIYFQNQISYLQSFLKNTNITLAFSMVTSLFLLLIYYCRSISFHLFKVTEVIYNSLINFMWMVYGMLGFGQILSHKRFQFVDHPLLVSGFETWCAELPLISVLQIQCISREN